MTNKIQLTVQQEKAIKLYKKSDLDLANFVSNRKKWSIYYVSIKDLEIDDFARLLYEPNSYEVVNEYEVGDNNVKETPSKIDIEKANSWLSDGTLTGLHPIGSSVSLKND